MAENHFSHHHPNFILLSLLFFPITPVIYILKIHFWLTKTSFSEFC